MILNNLSALQGENKNIKLKARWSSSSCPQYVAGSNTFPGKSCIISPTKVEFADNFTTLPQCSVVQPAIRLYTQGYYSQVPRKIADGNRLQGNAIFVKVINDIDVGFTLMSAETGYKLLK
jgi:hypothetical protein